MKAIEYGKVEEAYERRRARQKAIQVGINDEKAREIGKYIKGLGIKGVQHQVQGDQLRVNGKKRDDLQATIQKLREHDFGVRSTSRTSATDRGVFPGQTLVSWSGRAGGAGTRRALRRRVRTEEVGEVRLLPRERVDDVRRAWAGSMFIGICFAYASIFSSGAGERFARTEELRTAAVRFELAGARERHLQQRGRVSGEDHHRDRAEDVAVAITTTATHAAEDRAPHQHAARGR